MKGDISKSTQRAGKAWLTDLDVLNAPILNSLTASKVVFTDASKALTSTGIGTSSQFIKGDGSLDSTAYVTGTPWTGMGYLTSSSSLDPSKVSQTSSYRFVTDTEKGTWNGKQTAYTILGTLGALANASGWLHNDGAGALAYSTPSKSDVGLGNVANSDTTNPANITQAASYRFVSDTEKSTWNGKATLTDVAGVGYLTSSSSLDPSKVTQSATYRFASDTEKSTWNGKATLADVAGVGYLTSASSLDPSKVSQTSSYRFSTDAEKSTWNGKQAAITTGTTAQYFKGDLSLGTMPTALSSFTDDSTHRLTTDTEKSTWNGKATLADVAGVGYLTSASSLDPTKVSVDATHRFATDTEKTAWNGKQAAYTNLTSIGGLANAAGWLHNDGSGAFAYSTPSASDVGLGSVTNNKQVKGLSAGTTSGHLVTWGVDGYTVSDGGAVPSGGTPAGANTQIQFNKSGSLGADSGLAYTGSTLYVNNISTTAAALDFQFFLPNSTGSGAGNLYMQSGSGGTSSDSGGNIAIGGGDAGSAGGNGGDVQIIGGSAQAGNTNGGSILFQAGPKAGSGAQGVYKFLNNTSGNYGIADFSTVGTLSSTDKTFTFPDQTGIIYALPDAGANALVGWDDTDNKPTNITIGSRLTYTHATHTLSANAETDPIVAAISGIVKSNGSTISAATQGTDFGGSVVNTFNYTGGAQTWYKPTGAKWVEFIITGGGGGGGSGRKGATSTNRFGGEGGGGGAHVRGSVQATLIGDTETVTVGAGGTGGAAQTTNTSDGNAGLDGGKSQFSSFKASGGWHGVGGSTAASGPNGMAQSNRSGIVPNCNLSTNGSGGATVTGVGQSSASYPGFIEPGGGGNGGGITNANVVANGGSAGYVGNTTEVFDQIVGGTAGDSAGTLNGGNGSSSALVYIGTGGGGGASSKTTNAGGGGNGANYGGAGGGGGASLNSVGNSGKGGDGAPGIVVIITHF